MNRLNTEQNQRTFRIRNRREDVLTIVLEPWANEYVLSPGEDLEIREEGPATEDMLEIGVEAAHVVVFGRTGTVLRPFRNGQEIL